MSLALQDSADTQPDDPDGILDHDDKRKVARRACLMCRSKKVKCDGEDVARGSSESDQIKCTRCKNLGLVCEFIASQRGGRRKKKRQLLGPDGEGDFSPLVMFSGGDSISVPSPPADNLSVASTSLPTRSLHSSREDYNEPPPGNGYFYNDPRYFEFGPRHHFRKPHHRHRRHHGGGGGFGGPWGGPPHLHGPPGPGHPPPPPPLGYGGMGPPSEFGHGPRFRNFPPPRSPPRAPGSRGAHFMPDSRKPPVLPPAPQLNTNLLPPLDVDNYYRGPKFEYENSYYENYYRGYGYKKRQDDTAEPNAGVSSSSASSVKEINSNSDSHTLLKLIISERQIEYFNFPSYEIMGELIDLYYKYVNTCNRLIPSKIMFLSSLTIPNKNSQLFAIFTVACSYLLGGHDDRYARPAYWYCFVKKYWHLLGDISTFKTLNILLANLQGLSNSQGVEIVEKVKTYFKKLSVDFNGIKPSTNLNDFHRREDLDRSVWNTWIFMVLYRSTLRFPFDKVLSQAFVEFPESFPIIENNNKSISSLSEFSIENPQFLELFDSAYYHDLEKLLSIRDEDSDEKIEPHQFNLPSIMVLATRILEQVIDSISNYSLTSRNAMIFYSRIKLIETVFPELYKIEDKLLLIDGRLLSSKFAIFASMIHARQIFCSEFLLFKEVNKLLDFDNFIDQADIQNQMMFLLKPIFESIPLPMVFLIGKNSNAQQLVAFSQLLTTCFEISKVIELGQGVCDETISAGMNHPAIVGPTCLEPTNDLTDNLYFFKENYSAIVKHTEKPWYKSEGKTTKKSYSATSPDSWIQYPLFSSTVVHQAGLILASGLLISKYMELKKGTDGVDVWLSNSEINEKIHTIKLPETVSELLTSRFNKVSLLEVMKLFCDFLQLRSKLSLQGYGSYVVLTEINNYCKSVI